MGCCLLVWPMCGPRLINSLVQSDSAHGVWSTKGFQFFWQELQRLDTAKEGILNCYKVWSLMSTNIHYINLQLRRERPKITLQIEYTIQALLHQLTAEERKTQNNTLNRVYYTGLLTSTTCQGLHKIPKPCQINARALVPWISIDSSKYATNVYYDALKEATTNSNLSSPPLI